MSEIKHLEDFEIEKLFVVIKNTRDVALFKTILIYGLRVSEARRLKVEDIRFRDSRITITASKGGKSGDQYLSKEASKVLKAWIQEKTEIRNQVILDNIKLPPSKQKKPMDKDLIFTTRKGGAISNAHIFKLFKEYCKQAKIPMSKAHPHTLRHSIAMIMSEKGRSVEEVQAHLRHKSINSTMVYFGVSDRRRLAMQKDVLDELPK